jgi:phosphatidate cytidylyltransferase
VLKQRILTAVVLGVILLTVLFVLPPVATVWLVTLLVLVGAWEWAGFIRAESIVARIAFVAVVAACVAASWFLVLGDAQWTSYVLLAATAWWFVAFVWVIVAPERVSPLAAALAGLLALVPCWVALVTFTTRWERGTVWVLFVLLLVVAADTGAFFAGRFFGKVPLAPRVSPKKTWEGVIGGLVLAGIVAFAGGHWLVGQWGYPFISLCVAVAAISVVGDLTESMLKRAAGVKDSGSLFPGHGGMLDRIDSLTAAAPVLLFGLHGLSRIP